MMKKIICVFLILAVLLAACAHEEQPHISKTIFSELCEQYKGRSISDYRIIAALANGNQTVDVSAYRFDIEQKDDSTVSCGEYLLALHFAKKLGINIADKPTDEALSKLEAAVKNCDTLSAYELFLCTAALRAYVRSFDEKAVVASLEKRQSEVSGGFYDYVPEGSGVQSCEVEASAYAYMTYVMLRINVNDLNLDNALMFLGNSIEDDNTLSDTSKKSSCRVTALALTAMLASGIPGDGEISTALLKAINGFKTNNHYNDYKNSKTVNYVDEYVLLCASSALYGNPFTKAD